MFPALYTYFYFTCEFTYILCYIVILVVQLWSSCSFCHHCLCDICWPTLFALVCCILWVYIFILFIDGGPLVIPLIFCSSLSFLLIPLLCVLLSQSLALLPVFTMPDVTTPTANTPLDTDVSDPPVPSNPPPIINPLTPVSPTPNMDAHRPYSSSLPPTIRIDLPPRFSGDGGEDFCQWCRQLEVAVNAWPGAGESVALVQLLPSRLTGSAFLLWDSLPTETKNDFGMVKRKLSNIFSKKDEVSSFRSVLTARPRLSREPLEVYVAALRRLTLAAFPHFDSTAHDDEVFRRFLVGLNPDLQRKCHEHGATNIVHALRIAQQVERADEALRFTPPSSSASVSASVSVVAAAVPPVDPLKDLTQTVASLQLQIRELADSVRHGSVRPPSPSPYGRQSSASFSRRQSPARNPPRYDRTPNRSPSPRRPEGFTPYRQRSPSPFRREQEFRSNYSHDRSVGDRNYYPERSSRAQSRNSGYPPAPQNQYDPRSNERFTSSRRVSFSDTSPHSGNRF